MAVLVYVPNAMPSFGLDGQPVIAQLQFYENETLTPATVYADAALSTELTWPLVSDTSGNFPAVWSPDDGLYTVVWSTNDGQSKTWDGVNGQTTANGALLAAAQAAQVGAEAAEDTAVTAATSSQDILDQILAIGGYNGYSPILAVATDGARRVLQVTDWTGGAGTKPATGYVGVSGIVPNIADGVNIAGSATGDVSQSGLVTAGNLAVWSGSNQIQDGGLAGAMANFNVASQAEAEAGSSNTKGMTPLRVAQAIAALASPNATLRMLSKSANYQLLAADRGSLVSCTSSFTLSFDAAATLADNWFVYVYNAGTGDITLDPSGSETIDGLTSFIAYPGELRIVRSNGTALTSYVLKGFSRAFTSSGTFTKPPGYSDFEGEAWGGGGSGAGASLANAGGGGGGACVPFNLRASAVGTTETVTIGAGGASVTTTDGNDGGNTSLGTLVTAYGGAGGVSTTGGGGGGIFGKGSTTNGGAPRIASAANPGFGGGDGSVSAAPLPSVYGGGGGGGGSGSTAYPGAASVYGGGGGGGATAAGTTFGLGGSSSFGGAGGAGAYNANATAGSAPGGGGGGMAHSGTALNTGAGARGELRIRGVA